MAENLNIVELLRKNISDQREFEVLNDKIPLLKERIKNYQQKLARMSEVILEIDVEKIAKFDPQERGLYSDDVGSKELKEELMDLIVFAGLNEKYLNYLPIISQEIGIETINTFNRISSNLINRFSSLVEQIGDQTLKELSNQLDKNENYIQELATKLNFQKELIQDFTGKEKNNYVGIIEGHLSWVMRDHDAYFNEKDGNSRSSLVFGYLARYQEILIGLSVYFFIENYEILDETDRALFFEGGNINAKVIYEKIRKYLKNDRITRILKTTDLRNNRNLFTHPFETFLKDQNVFGQIKKISNDSRYFEKLHNDLIEVLKYFINQFNDSLSKLNKFIN